MTGWGGRLAAMRHRLARGPGSWIRTSSIARGRGHVVVVPCVDTEGDFRQGAARWEDSPEPSLSWGPYEPNGDVSRMMSAWRRQHCDSTGKPLRLTWFVRADRFYARAGRRAAVIEALRRRFDDRLTEFGDELAFHHHQMTWEGAPPGRWRYDRDFAANRDYESALAALLIEGGFFPSAFRAGALMMTDPLNRWLEEYVPFDFTLLVSPRPRRSRGKQHLAEAFDWTRAPNDWSWYHPAAEDYQRPGSMRRVLFPCTDALQALDAAFACAAGGAEVVAGIYTHDFGPFLPFLLAAVRRLHALSRRHRVSYEFLTASEAGRRALGWTSTPWELTLQVDARARALEVSVDRPLFGPAPFACVADQEGYRVLSLERTAEGRWRAPIPGTGRVRVGAGACDVTATPAHAVAIVGSGAPVSNVRVG